MTSSSPSIRRKRAVESFGPARRGFCEEKMAQAPPIKRSRALDFLFS